MTYGWHLMPISNTWMALIEGESREEMEIVNFSYWKRRDSNMSTIKCSCFGNEKRERLCSEWIFWEQWPPEFGHWKCRQWRSYMTNTLIGNVLALPISRKIGLKIYWAWPHPSEKEPVSHSVSLPHQEASINLLSLSIIGPTEWKPQSGETNQTDHMDHSLVELNETISHAM